MGPTFIAWVAWHDCDLPGPPTFAGQAYVGEHGTQRAEFYAVLHGLSAALAYARASPAERRPALVMVHIDNVPVFKIMTGESTPNMLRRHFEATADLCSALGDVSVGVEWVSVSERHPRHRVADRMSKLAHNQVLVEKDWRPTDKSAE